MFNPHVEQYDIMFENEKDHWWYLGLQDLYKSWLKKLNPSPSNILDAGCGTGVNLEIVSKMFPNANVAGIDVSDKALSYCKKRKLSNLYKESVTSLPFANNTFDCIYSFDVLNFVEVNEHHNAVSEFFRCLKPGGYLLLNVSALEWLRSSHDIAWDTKKRFTKKGLAKLIENGGFEIIEATYRICLLFLPALFAKLLDKVLKNEPGSHTGAIKQTSPVFNKTLQKIMLLENRLINHISMPIGTSVFVIAKKT